MIVFMLIWKRKISSPHQSECGAVVVGEGVEAIIILPAKDVWVWEIQQLLVKCLFLHMFCFPKVF